MASVDYEGTTPQGRFTFTVEDGAALKFQRQRLESDGPAFVVEFEQPATGSLTFRWGPQGKTEEVRAASLWHLLLAQPVITKDELVPVLSFLRLDWDLPGAVLKIEEALVRAASGGRVPDRDRWNSLVIALGSEQYSERRAADRQLRMAGQSVVPFLEGLDPAQLDAEQRQRIRQIVQSLAGSQREDTPQSAAAWLAVDPRIWYSLLGRDDTELRKVAIEQLRRLVSEALAFDPTAEAATRQQQIAVIGQQLFPASADLPARSPAPDDEPNP